MMKIFFIIIFLMIMLVKNKMLMFYYNLNYLISFMMMFLYLFKDMIWVNISFYFSMSYYSIMLIILSMWILSLMMMCLDKLESYKMIIFMILLFMLIFFFSTMDLLLFYFSFEVSLIPTFFLILFWGSNPERVNAAYYLLMYMLMFSFPLLVYIMDMYVYGMTFSFNLMIIIMKNYLFSLWTFMMVYMAFFIKMPIYLFHIWLPKAHVEAPVYGSMILAGILLKMGSYGLLRLMEIFINSSYTYGYIIFSVSMVGGLLVSMMCLIQIDMKSLVAYSSVVHMNMMLCSLLTMCKLGFLSSYIMMVSHGLCSSGLFYMVNLYYKRTHSRLLFLNKGMLSLLPSLGLWWFLLCVINFSFPFSINFFSEVMMLGTIMNWEISMMFYLVLICFFSSAYSLYLFSYVQHGSYFMENKFLGSLLKENLILILHIYPLFVFVMNMVLFL
uniref:NADH-ubiquinone oxidoreductase chain 4 n=1 Tax=Aphaenogaster famelica TaxID=255788 RepID=A0A6B9BLT4_9HYME|nr:NADH dehydrogenase subunit 4 [Aphaenogaster famelica]QGW36313.1 NADH dehydrogenase subunit 4 [Aphaenogaster famelica]